MIPKYQLPIGFTPLIIDYSFNYDQSPKEMIKQFLTSTLGPLG
jgi:hypothetical protein